MTPCRGCGAALGDADGNDTCVKCLAIWDATEAEIWREPKPHCRGCGTPLVPKGVASLCLSCFAHGYGSPPRAEGPMRRLLAWMVRGPDSGRGGSR